MTRLTGLDALRGIAALMVLWYHTAQPGRFYLAVDFFFVLSGFVMARTYEGRFTEIGAARFLFARWKRFLPLIALGAGLGVIASFGDDLFWNLLALFMLAIFCSPIFAADEGFPLNPPQWSLFSELAANFLHALVLHRISIGQLLCLSVTALAVSIWHNPNGLSHEPLPSVARVLISYPLGIVLWRINGDTPRLSWSAGAFALIAAPVFVSVLPEWMDFVFVLVMPIVVVCGLNSPPLGRAMAFVGAMSFPLYATHGPIIVSSIDVTGSRFAGAIIAIALATAITAIPLIRRKNPLELRIKSQ